MVCQTAVGITCLFKKKSLKACKTLSRGDHAMKDGSSIRKYQPELIGKQGKK